MTALGSTTAVTLFTNNANDFSTSAYTVIGIVLGIAVALLIIGFAWRKLKQKVTGKGF